MAQRRTSKRGLKKQRDRAFASSLQLLGPNDGDYSDVGTGNGGFEDGYAFDDAAAQAIVLSPGSSVQVMACFHSHPAAASRAFHSLFGV